MATAKNIGRETTERTAHRGRLHIAASAAGAAALAVYLFTLAPSVGFIDAGELAAVAHTFGIAHPTGYPLFTVLAGLWAYLPLGDGIVRLNVFAAVLTAVAVALHVYFIHFLLGLLRRRPQRAVKGKKSAGAGTKGGPAPFPEDVRVALAAFGALFIAFSETFWKTALSVEVYALHLPLVTAAMLLFARATLDRSADERARLRFLCAAALVLGLSFANHMTTLLLLPAFAVVYFRVHGFRAQAWRSIGRAALFFTGGLLLYLYLPLRAAASPVLNWGNPATLERFLWHVTGRQYQVWMFEGLKAAGKQLSWFLSTYPAEFGWVGAVLCIAGAVAAFRRERLVGTFLVLLFVGCIAYAVNYSIHDIESYFLLAYMTSGVWAAFGLGAVYAASRKRRAIPLAAGALAVGVLLGANYPEVSQRGNHLVEDYTRNMFASLAPNAVILSYQWDYWVSASYYYQLVERLRPDVVVIDKELLRRSWYFEQLRRRYPEIYRRSQPKIQAFLAELDKFEHGKPYDPETIESRYNEMIADFADANYRDRPVYVTVEIEKHLFPGYARVPEGLALRLFKPGEIPPPASLREELFRFRPFHRRERLVSGLFSMYATMLTNHGVRFMEYGKYREAERCFLRALEIDPAHTQAGEWYRRVREASRG